MPTEYFEQLRQETNKPSYFDLIQRELANPGSTQKPEEEKEEQAPVRKDFFKAGISNIFNRFGVKTSTEAIASPETEELSRKTPFGLLGKQFTESQEAFEELREPLTQTITIRGKEVPISIDPTIMLAGIEKLGAEGIKQAPKLFKGFKDITTRILDRLKSKRTVSKQFIEDLTNMPELRQVERDLIRETVKESPKEVPIQEFADRVKTKLLPLEATDTAGTGAKGISFVPDDQVTRSDLLRYENTTLPSELRGNVADYDEVIYQSPIKNSAGDVHFNSEDVPNYFAHTRVEDMADGSTRRVIEAQSDLFQKGRLEREGDQASQILADRQKSKIFNKQLSEAEIFSEKEASRRLSELSKLQPYRNTWHERIIREEVRRAAQDGKTKLQFPTGETAMKVEGLGVDRQFNHWITPKTGRPLQVEELKIGKEIEFLNQQGVTSPQGWIITDILGDGKFKAVPKRSDNTLRLEMNNDRGIVEKAKELGLYDSDIGVTDNGLRNKTLLDIHEKEFMQGLEETFDISGKVDTSNPIYRFYEKDVQKFLNRNFNAKQITDPQGVKWFEVDITKEMAKEPVQAFGFSKLGVAAGIGGGIAAILALPPLLGQIFDSTEQNQDMVETVKQNILNSKTQEELDRAFEGINAIRNPNDISFLAQLAKEKERLLNQ